ncbi:MAG: glycosyltransferase family 4 protein, partial [Thermoanaerobaculia bacterium]
VRFGALRAKPWSGALSIEDLVRLYRTLRPSVVHHVTFKAVLYGTIAARLTGVGAVVNAMTGLGDVFAANSLSDRGWRAVTVALFRIFVRHPNMRIVVQNADDRDVLVNAGAVRPEQTALIRGSGVDPAFFVPAPARGAHTPVVICAARMVLNKGIGEFVSAARQLRSEGVDARFLLAGDRATDSGKGIPDSVFDGWVREGAIEYAGLREDIRELNAQADIACLPSWGGEGVPKSLIEAASSELPIVTTDVPGCRDIVRQGENGFLVPPRAVEPLAEALRTLILDPELGHRMGARGRAIVIAEFSLERVIASTLKIYEELA